MGVSRYGFTHAWSLLKALPSQQGYYGTLHPAIAGMMGRARAAGGFAQPRLDTAGNVMRGTDNQMITDLVTDAEGNVIEPADRNRKISRDISPIRDQYVAMTSSGIPLSELPARGKSEFGGQKLPPEAFTTQTQKVTGLGTEPEEGFFTGREKRLGAGGFEAAAGRQLTGGQRGGRMDVRGGSQSGIHKPLRGEDDEGKAVNRRATSRRPAKLSNQEGVGVRAKLGGASAEFLDREKEPEPSEEERLAAMMRELGMDATADTSRQAAPELEDDDDFGPDYDGATNLTPLSGPRLARLRAGIAAQDEPPNLNIPVDPVTMSMFEGRMPNPSEVVTSRGHNTRQKLLEAMQSAGRSAGSAGQTQIDRQA